MNTRKISMIVGGLLLCAAGTTYLMLLQDDRRATAEVTAIDDSARPPVVDSRISDHVTEGSIDHSGPSAVIPGDAALAHQPAVPAPASALAGVPAPPAAASAASPLAAQVAVQPKPPAQLKQAPSTAVATVNVHEAGTPKVVSAQPAHRGQEGLDRRAITTQGATPETDELVRESAKLDPSLPPPDTSATRAALDQRSSKPGTGSNPVAAAMTDQLVRESAKLDPSLPPPR
ncbi:hypothetical protein [Paraburkholderia saeva]|nr:hypothetical protein [Paraburkholderia saeva]